MYPFRGPCRGILFIKPRGIHPVRKPLEHQRSLLKIREDTWCDTEIILHNIKFGQIEVGVYHP